MSATGLELLMVHADDRRPVAGLAAGSASSQGTERQVLPEHLWDDSVAPDDLSRQRWGVLAPEGPEGDRLLELVAPLMTHRAAQQGAEVRVHRVARGMDAQAADRWRDRVYHPQDDLDLEVPRYLLVLGDLDGVSLETQQVLAANRAFPGRLCFDQPAHYEAYVDKLLRWEAHAAGGDGDTRGEALLYTAHDLTEATRVGHRALMAPGLGMLRKHLDLGQLPAARLEANTDDDADPDVFLALARGQRPAVLFSMSHGEGPPRRGWQDPGEQRERQGAMSFGSSGSLQASELARAPFLPGGIWFMLACFGAGTPARSSYHHWLRQLEAVGAFSGAAVALEALDSAGKGFVGAVPKATLANEAGPLAFVGHVDLAWTYGFQDAEERQLNRSARYMGVVRSLLERHRAGVALAELYRHVGSLDTSLSLLQDAEAQGQAPVQGPGAASKGGGGASEAERARQRGNIWMVRQDLQAYLLLGDPAARLPLRDPAAAQQAGPEAEPPEVIVQSQAPARAPAGEAAAELALEVEAWRFEELLGAHLMGDLGLDRLASQLGLDRATARRAVQAYTRAGRRAVGLPEEG